MGEINWPFAPPPNYFRALEFCRNTSPTKARWEKNLAPQPPEERYRGSKEKFPLTPPQNPFDVFAQNFLMASALCPLRVAKIW